jgi:pilus assembly protein Flp/PilA
MMLSLIKTFRKDERGATATEYAMLVVFIALIVAVGAQALGSDLSNLFSAIGTQLNTTAAAIPPLPSTHP